MSDPIEIDDAIILLIGSGSPKNPGGSLSGITRLEKLIFLLERETNSKNWLDQDADFEAYNFGPFSQKIYQAVDTLGAAGLLLDSSKESSDTTDSWEQREGIGLNPDPYSTRDFQLTDRGWRYFNALSGELSKDALDELRDFKNQFVNLPLRQLIRYVYMKYDNFTTKSIIRDEVLGDRA
ncbi:hypothetical protein [Paeniglutamicibacter kerguelensis]|uniref:Uncharacterized protein YwgA n=1 Tax=Paeniglutamicibacter kerguelensis TaxID=254788 RepID=A0ABS4XHI7_9MICC|nr:hypothetical protein [Paeniglutamicibacter kerguelensis]MBP2387937.1 uncharacterized protein YwgA [Paeniglutamicibacter kerguelensis]